MSNNNNSCPQANSNHRLAIEKYVDLRGERDIAAKNLALIKDEALAAKNRLKSAKNDLTDVANVDHNIRKHRESVIEFLIDYIDAAEEYITLATSIWNRKKSALDDYLPSIQANARNACENFLRDHGRHSVETTAQP